MYYLALSTRIEREQHCISYNAMLLSKTMKPTAVKQLIVKISGLNEF